MTLFRSFLAAVLWAIGFIALLALITILFNHWMLQPAQLPAPVQPGEVLR